LLTERGINGGDSIKALVFLTILLTVAAQGLTAGTIAKLLGITSTQATGVVMVGCNPLSLLIARLFRDRGESVVFIDTDADACEDAIEAGFRVFISSALDADILEEADLESSGTFLAITNNGEVNAVVSQRAMEEFQPPRVLAVFPKGKAPEKTQEDAAGSTATAKGAKVKRAFVAQMPLKTWNQHLIDREVKLGETLLRREGFLFQQAHLKALIRANELVPLVLVRDQRLQIAAAKDDWQAGDRIIYLLHDPKPRLLKRLSGSSNPELTIEKLPAVEEVPMPAPTQKPLLPDEPSALPKSDQNGSDNGTKTSPLSKPKAGSAQATPPPDKPLEENPSNRPSDRSNKPTNESDKLPASSN
ncbi:MAG: NAD-binding protein, partial [Cyanobacteria bacterium P01_C01_bin.73]